MFAAPTTLALHEMRCDDGTAPAALDQPIPYALAVSPPQPVRPRSGYFKVIPDHGDPKRALVAPLDGVFVYRDRADNRSVRAAYDLAVKLVAQLTKGARVVAFNSPAGHWPLLSGTVS